LIVVATAAFVLSATWAYAVFGPAHHMFLWFAGRRNFVWTPTWSAIAAALVVAATSGLALTIAVGPELLLVGAASITAALAYSGGPRPYASAGLGEAFVFVFFGLVATTGSAYVQVERVPLLTALAAVPVGLLASAILVVNNLRDVPTDAATGKVTLAVRLGPRRTRHLYAALVVASGLCLIPIAVAAADWTDVLPPAACYALVPALVREVYRNDGPGLVKCLSLTSAFHLVFGGAATVGLWR